MVLCDVEEYAYRKPDGIYIVSIGCLKDCVKLTDFNIPKSLTVLRDGIFDNVLFNCFSIPDNIVVVEHGAFYNTHGFRALCIPKTVRIFDTDGFGFPASGIVYYEGSEQEFNNLSLSSNVSAKNAIKYFDCAPVTFKTVSNDSYTYIESSMKDVFIKGLLIKI